MEGPNEFKPLSLEEARSLIREKTGLNVGADDPVLALVTLQEAFLADLQALLERHNKAATVIIGDAMNELTDKLASETQTFAQAVSALTKEGTTRGLQEMVKAMESHTRFLFMASVANVAVPAIMFALLLGVLLWKL